MSWAASARPWPHPGLRVRLLAFNALLVFLPAAGVLFLDAHERRLLVDQERAMAQQARVLAAALSGDRLHDSAARILDALDQRSDARIRVVDPAGRVVADSVRSAPKRGASSDTAAPDRSARSWLYRLGALPFRLWRGFLGPGAASHSTADAYAAGAGAGAPLLGPEIRAALAGRYGAATRISSGGQRSVTLYSAVPVRDASTHVVGAVLVSQSTLRILQALYALRLGVFRVFLGSLGVAIVLSLLVSRTIARPLRALRDQAERVVDRRGRWRGHFALPPRGDEIGDLAGALEALRERLEERVRDAEAFASDVAHEFRNPLAAIRTAAEMIHAAEAPRDRSRFIQLIEHEVARLEKMLTSLRELGRLDAGICDEPREPIDLAALVESVAKQHMRATGRELRLRLEGREHSVEASPLRLEQVLDNLLANAESFSPPDAPIDLEVVEAGPQVVLRVLDRGPGIPAAHRERVFERFFSHRPGLHEVKTHAGLGLSIVRAIIDSEGGQIRSGARPGGGGLLEVRLPSVSSCCSAPGRASAR